MSVKLKLALVAAGGLLAMGLVAAWQVAGFTIKGHEKLLRENLAQEVSMTARLASLQSEHFSSRLSQLAAIEESRRRNFSEASSVQPGRSFLKSDFVLLSLLELNSGRWQPKWVASKAGYSRNWPATYPQQMLQSLPFAGVSGGNTIWYQVQDPQRRPLFAVVIATQDPNTQKNYRAVGILNAQAFSEVSEPFKGRQREFFVVDERGYALAYSESQYVGAQLKQHPVVEKVMAEREVSGIWPAANLQGETVMAAYERLGQTNLYAAVMSPVQSQWSGAVGEFVKFFGFGLAILIVVLALGFVALNPMILGFRALRSAVADLAEGRVPQLPPNPYIEPVRGAVSSLMQNEGASQVPTAAPTPETKAKPVEISQEKLQEEKTAAYKQIGKGLSQAMKGPIAAILGHAQLARSKAQESSLKDHFVVIEREARRAREMVENLIRLTGDKSKEKTRVDLQEVVMSALSQVRPAMTAKGVRLNKDLAQSSSIMAHRGQLQTVIEEILSNAIDSMTEEAQKELSVSLEQSGEMARLVISDTGCGVDESELDKIFEPFYTTKDQDENSGLGLTVVKGVVESFKGKVHLESNRGQGTQVVIDFPLAAKQKDRMVAVSEEMMETAPDVATPDQDQQSPVAKSEKNSPQKTPLSVVKPEASAATAQPGKKPAHRPTHRPGGVKAEASGEDVKAGLEGKKPLSGSDTNHLPTPPSNDEVTLVGRDPQHDEVFGALGDEFQEEEISAANLSSEKRASSELNVTIRRPKVRGKN